MSTALTGHRSSWSTLPNVRAICSKFLAAASSSPFVEDAATALWEEPYEGAWCPRIANLPPVTQVLRVTARSTEVPGVESIASSPLPGVERALEGRGDDRDPRGEGRT